MSSRTIESTTAPLAMDELEYRAMLASNGGEFCARIAREILAERQVAPQAKALSPAHREINRLFHHLWTKAVGTHDYDKREWLALAKVLWENGRIPL